MVKSHVQKYCDFNNIYYENEEGKNHLALYDQTT